jgi:hypothetical protein
MTRTSSRRRPRSSSALRVELVVVRCEYPGRQLTFRIDDRPPLRFWRVECEGRVFHSPLTVSGNEIPELFFPSLARASVAHHGL